MGFPIAECEADGAFVLTKPDGTGGLVSPSTIAEQVAYEVGDPSAYLLPDVSCDWSDVRLESVGVNRVRVSGARGRAPTSSYKVCATFIDGYRASVTMMVAGREAVDKAQAVGRAILARSSRLMRQAGFDDFSETLLETLGAETTHGASSRARGAREVVLKIGVRHASSDALRIFAREIFPAATAMAQGLTGFAGGRPEPQSVIRSASFLVDKAEVPVRVRRGDVNVALAIPVPASPPATPRAGPAKVPSPPFNEPIAFVPLIAVAHGRSGDKGDIANIGIIGRRREFVPALRQGLTADAVRDYFAHYVEGRVERFDWPGLDGFNFLLHRALGGGGVASLRHDPQGKALAQALMDFPLPVPASWLEPGGWLENWTETLPLPTSPDGAAR